MTPEPRLRRCDLTVLPKSQPFDLSCSEERQQIHGRNISPCARYGAPPLRTHYKPSSVMLCQAEPPSLILVLLLQLNSWLVRTSQAFIKPRWCLNQSVNRPSSGQRGVVLEQIICTKLPFTGVGVCCSRCVKRPPHQTQQKIEPRKTQTIMVLGYARLGYTNPPHQTRTFVQKTKHQSYGTLF